MKVKDACASGSITGRPMRQVDKPRLRVGRQGQKPSD